ncbi:ABC transporter substrate-binding protein [Pseudomonas gingeri]|uniref:ABC transporter substrate-binding protein n=1 Tax=Pseudomonas gingeri TaxID=117681 RepID=UPI0015A49196|nr:ABC transporter substrate-binding protein [Pseudomonas gingeri]NWD70922.1 ABC transporter substrate-binding protein [Pseudomonas gingeri]NWD73027.1 ABC transporter substrate-binding protein [Pseudomonas gingeri]
MIKPRAFLRLSALCGALLFGHAAIASAHEVTDVLGRQVEVPDHVQRVVLGEGRLISAFALLDRDAPFQRIVGWQNDLRLLDPHTYAAYAAKFPMVKDIPLIGQASEQSVSAEEILSLKPDLAVFSISGHGPTEHSPVADVLAKAGIAVLFVDFRINPIKGTHVSLDALGQALGREKEAKAYLDFYDQHVKAITDKVAGLADKPRPKVFLELLAGAWQAPGHTTGKSGMGEVIRTVGGVNIAEGVVPGALGDISVEFALKADPDVYIATGNHKPGLMLGADVSPAEAREAFNTVLARPEFKNLRAIRAGNAHGLWHDFYNSPYNLLAIEALAKWVHPELFAGLDPQRTMDEINQQFLGTPLKGAYWIDAQP